ncbi:hypothetical protein FA15DRAFT_62316 [Coprinopsis marcescibilis]|uniref:Rpr2-domain-containing protein n=1 Tax=Coprinopsis marcescibilis TaxID=230819 RepID=A0A5C3KNM5_COPMA|nr:hypothetical protein FA15DRAFT_62316 [Coprinopsis marcescibilis]
MAKAKTDSKKEKEVMPNANNVPNREILQRLNFMYQAGVCLGSLGAGEGSRALSVPLAGVVLDDSAAAAEKNGGKGRRGKGKRNRKAKVTVKKGLNDLSVLYSKSMQEVGAKTTVKMDPGMKRALCGGCGAALVLGVSASCRVRKLPSHGRAVIYRCLGCGSAKRVPAPPSPTFVLPRASSGENVDSDSDIAERPAAAVQEKVALDPDVVMSDSTAGGRVPASSSPSGSTPVVVVGKEGGGKRARPPRVPPLFARLDAGHVVFCGGEKVVDESCGLVS